jgi:hypothetical protein
LKTGLAGVFFANGAKAEPEIGFSLIPHRKIV